MHPAFQIEANVRAYLERELSLEDFRRWVVTMRGPMLSLPADLPGTKLATTIELALVELKDGVLTERQFRKLLRQGIRHAPQFVISANQLDDNYASSDAMTNSESGAFDLAPTPGPRLQTLAGTSS
jgi:hypothetical protein